MGPNVWKTIETIYFDICSLLQLLEWLQNMKRFSEYVPPRSELLDSALQNRIKEILTPHQALTKPELIIPQVIKWNIPEYGSIKGRKAGNGYFGGYLQDTQFG